MLDTVQSLVDALAVELGQPVGLDDRRPRAVAYSPHVDDVDAVRRDTILRRETPPEIAERLRSRGIEQAHEHLRIPRDEEFAMKARVCVPVRHQEALLGFLWLLDEPEPVRGPQLRAAVECARELAAHLDRARRTDSEDRAREAAYVRRLLTDRAGPGTAAAIPWHSRGIAGAPLYACLVVEVVCGAAPCRASAPALAAGMDAMQRALPPKRLVAALDEDRAVAVLAHDGPEEPAARARALRDEVAGRLAPCPGCRVVAGVGRSRPTPAGVPGSCDEAAQAARVAIAVEELGPVGEWVRLGAYRTIERLAAPDGHAAAVPDALARLLGDGDAATLVPTLEAYLDSGGDAQATAARLLIHRSSLYNRLHRIEAVAGVDLRSGDSRLELHLGLRLWRLAGRP